MKEDKVQEIMGLVDDVMSKHDDYQEHQISKNWAEYESSRGRLEAALCKLVEQDANLGSDNDYAKENGLMLTPFGWISKNAQDACANFL